MYKKWTKEYTKKYMKEYRKSSKWKKYRSEYNKTIRGCLMNCFSRMKERCNNSKSQDYKYYGGRGIKLKFKSPNEFVNYVMNKLQIDPRNLQIDRINNDGNYESGNIRFVTCGKNLKNRRKWAKNVATQMA